MDLRGEKRSHRFFLLIQALYSKTDRFALHLRDGNGNECGGEFTVKPERVVEGAGFTWADFLERYVQCDVGEDELKAFGQDLFRAVIGETGLAGTWSSIMSGAGGRPLVMAAEFSRNTEAMAELPLELIHDGVNFVFARPGFGLERIILGTPLQDFIAPARPRALFAWAQPIGSGGYFDPGLHETALRNVFGERLTVLEDATLDGIEKSLDEGEFDYLHILAHGYRDAGSAGICLTGDDGGLDPAEAQRLANAVQGRHLKLVFLCSCQTAVTNGRAFSGVGQQLLARQGGDISCVVATQANLPVRDSEKLTERFYRLLGEAGNPPQALARSRRDAFGAANMAWSVPTLLSRPSNHIFEARLNVNRGLPERKATYQTREMEAEGLKALSENRFISIVGLPGIGKTETGREIARKALEEGLADRVIYQDVLPDQTVGQVRALLGTALGQVGIKEDLELAAAFDACPEKILLLLDNAEDLMKTQENETLFRDMIDALLGNAGRLSILLTTRWLLGGAQMPERRLEAPPMSRAQTSALLEAELRQRGVFETEWPDDPAWAGIMNIIDGHPRSLWLIAGHFDHRMGSPENVLSKLKAHREKAIVEPGLLGRADLLHSLNKDQKNRLKSLVASMNLSFDVLEKRHPDAANVYIALSLFPAGLPDKVAQEVAGGAGSLALHHIYYYHLAAWHNGRTFYPVPLHWYAERLRRQRGVDEAIYMGRALEAFGEYVTAWNEQITTGAIVAGVDALLAEEANLLALAEWAKTHDENGKKRSRMAGIASSAANGLNLADRFDTLQTLLKQGLKLAKAANDKLGEANCLKSMGDLQMRMSDLSGAQSSYAEALPVHREIRDRLGEANCLQSMGLLILIGGDAGKAFQRFSEALELHGAIQNLMGRQAALGYMARAAQAGGARDQALLLAEASLTLGRQINDRFGQSITLRFQFEIWQTSQEPLASRATMVLLERRLGEMGDSQGAAQYAEALEQMKAQISGDVFQNLEENAEAIRADAIDKTLKRFEKTGQNILSELHG